MKTSCIRLMCMLTLAIALVFLLYLPSYSSADGILNTRYEFIQAMETYSESGVTEYQLNLSPDLLSDIKAGMDDWVSEARANCGIRSFTYAFSERAGTLRLSNIEYRSAVRIMQSVRTNRTSVLSGREILALQKAKSIVKSAPDEILARERYLHDALCTLVEYYTDDTDSYDEKDQAIGALLNGKADCDGYSEAFYLLCNLAGIPARFQHGDTIEKGDRSDVTHMWNLVNIYGMWLMVDVTWDDLDMAEGNVYLYYNIGSKRASETHIWRKDTVPVEWAEKAGNFTRTADIAEGYANSIKVAESYIRDKLTDRNASRAALSFSQEIDLEQNKDIVSSWIYAIGVKDYYWKFGGHSIEILVKERYDEYRIVKNDSEALAYISEMKNAGKSDFTIFFSGDYGKNLFSDDLTGLYALEGQFGIAQDDMLYSDKSCRVSYTNVSFDDYFRVCRTEQEVLDYIAELTKPRIDHFSICIPGQYGSSLLKNDLAAYRILEGQFGLENNNMVYYSKYQKFVYSNVRYSDHFQVCRSENDIIEFVNNCARTGVSDFSFSIPNNYGASLFHNKLEKLSSVLHQTLLSSDRDLTYYDKSQLVIIRNASYWPAMNRVSLKDLDTCIRRVLSSQPGSAAFWNDGTFEWNDRNFKQLSISIYRCGVDSYRYIISPERVEILNIAYVSDFCLVSSEDDILNYLRSCNSRSQYSFRLYCTESLYAKLSANNFDRFFTLTSSVLKKGQSISYIGDYYMISMENVKYK